MAGNAAHRRTRQESSIAVLRTVKVAVGQIACSLGDLDANVRKMRAFSGRAKEAGADLIVFPEVADTGYSMPVIKANAATWEGGPVAELQKISKELSIAIISGVSERDAGAIVKTSDLAAFRPS